MVSLSVCNANPCLEKHEPISRNRSLPVALLAESFFSSLEAFFEEIFLQRFLALFQVLLKRTSSSSSCSIILLSLVLCDLGVRILSVSLWKWVLENCLHFCVIDLLQRFFFLVKSICSMSSTLLQEEARVISLKPWFQKPALTNLQVMSLTCVCWASSSW